VDQNCIPATTPATVAASVPAVRGAAGPAVPATGPLVSGRAVLPNVPRSIRLRYLTRIICNATGVCPACGVITGDPSEPEPIRHAQVEQRFPGR
jgi:hypothetical protein